MKPLWILCILLPAEIQHFWMLHWVSLIRVSRWKQLSSKHWNSFYFYLFKIINMRKQKNPQPPNWCVCKNHEAITFWWSLLSRHRCSPRAAKGTEGGCRVRWEVKGNTIHQIFCSFVIRKLSRWKSWVWIRNPSSLPALSPLLPFHLWLTQCRIH